MGGVSAALVFGLSCILISSQFGGTEANGFPDVAEQPYRTSYHFQSPKNWLNDPNGPMFYNGLYHLFYQYNPNGAVFGDVMIWAHSISRDLVNWVHLDHALEPSEPFDLKSCWSGSVTILPGKGPVILYTGIDANGTQVQNLATPKDPNDLFLTEWIKFSGNPIMVPPKGIAPDNFRDPTTAWKGPDGKWRVTVGSYKDDRGLAVLYTSDDFVHWTEHPNPLYSAETPGMWECPDFFPVFLNSTNGVETSVQGQNVKHVMKASHADVAHDFYQLGTYHSDIDRYLPETDPARFDYGKFYASKTFFDSGKNRRIMWGWVNESDSSKDDVEKGWSGLQTIPRTIWLDGGGKQLMQWPINEIETLRDEEVGIHDKTLKGGSVVEVSGITASQADVDVLFQVPNLDVAEFMDPSWDDPELLCNDKNSKITGSLGPFGLLVLASKDLSEHTAIFFRIFRSHNRHVVLMCSDQSRSSMRSGLDKRTFGAFVDIDPRLEKIYLRSLIDHSIVESFGGQGKACITARVYPQLAIGKEVYLYAFNNGTEDVVISRLSAWSMNKAQLKAKDQDGLRYTSSQLTNDAISADEL